MPVVKLSALSSQRSAKEPKCRICGCKQYDACPGGCGWADGDLCTVCLAFREALIAYIEEARAVSAASLKRLFAEAQEAMGVPPSIVPKRSPEKKAREFNRLFPVGTRVRYWKGAREGRGKESVTRSEASVLSGHTAVVWLEGVSGAIALSHVEPLPC
jgi:hypothetical protein